jgi:hypothetical protein
MHALLVLQMISNFLKLSSIFALFKVALCLPPGSYARKISYWAHTCHNPPNHYIIELGVHHIYKSSNHKSSHTPSGCDHKIIRTNSTPKLFRIHTLLHHRHIRTPVPFSKKVLQCCSCYRKCETFGLKQSHPQERERDQSRGLADSGKVARAKLWSQDAPDDRGGGAEENVHRTPKKWELELFVWVRENEE